MTIPQGRSSGQGKFQRSSYQKVFPSVESFPQGARKSPLTEPFKREGPKHKGNLSYPHRELARQIPLITLTYLCDKEEKQKLIKYLFSYLK